MYGGSRLTGDGYKRPKHTFQDKLTDEEITDKLRFYKKVDNIKDVPLSTHLRYMLIEDNGENKFRMGGILLRADGLPNYVVLSNGGKSWSVQVKNCIFFQKVSYEELGKQIDELEESKMLWEKQLNKLKNRIGG